MNACSWMCMIKKYYTLYSDLSFGHFQISKAFAEGRTSLEDYVQTLKTAAGIPILIEAVGIGRGKEDLTDIAREPTKNNQVFPVQPEVPIGKECSSLSSRDIIKVLNGDFRLSKARSSDIFWEAVWPRLLARGWHSEQPTNTGYYVSQHQLVFLIPGVKKFSRRKLVKGYHYFDSVTDVLRLVASEPELIELEAEDPRVSSCKEENKRAPEPTLNRRDPDDRQHHSYFKPQVSTCSSDSTTLTVVDTSLKFRETALKVREMKVFPVDTKNTSRLNSEEIGDNSYRYSVDDSQSADMLLKGQKRTNIAKGIVDNSNSSKNMPINDSEGVKKLVEVCQDDKLTRTVKNKFTQRQRPGCSNVLPPLMKQRRLASCVKDDTSRSMEKFMVSSGSKEVGPSFVSNSPDVSDAGPLHEKVFLGSSSAHCRPEKESSDGFVHEKTYGIEIAPVKNARPQSRPLIDLNVPQIPLDSENGEFYMMELDNSLQSSMAHVLGVSSDKYELVEPKVLNNSIDINAAEKPPVVNPRRQSTRNRPLTSRALEALASGFLSRNRRRKDRESQITDNPASGPSHRGHIRATVSSNSGSTSIGFVDDKEGNEVGGVCNGKKTRVSDPLVETGRKAAEELVEISQDVYHPGVL
ncbi:hypothetical protein Acr_15g0015880 [Actinidia rufa]|uniref:DUF7650 domain-containing protein n=1 Tax=Actinidia rufa TaxID=165716 RepID=A0A7J0FXR7_9ERIC|nr:hypothetical protein Acr_15g0015880 [Actinidia rufa]